MRSMSSHGLKVWAADTSHKNICSISRFCSGSFVYPDPFEDELNFIDCLVNKVRELSPKMLLPTHDESIVILRNRHRFPDNLLIPYETCDLLLTLSNKAESTNIAEKVGIPVPKVYHSANDIKNFPVVFKTVIGNSAKGVFFPSNQSELFQLMQKYSSTQCLLEEFIDGMDYSVDCVRWDGFWKSSVYSALVTKTEGGGTTTQREIVSMPELEQYAKVLLDHVDYHGVCGLDFRYDTKTGRIAYIETNARFTGGLATPIFAGFDIPWVLYKLATEGYYDEPIKIKVGTKTKWILGDVITFVDRLFSLKLSFKEMKRVFTFTGFDGYDDFFSDDKKAILGEMSYYFEKLVKNRKLNP